MPSLKAVAADPRSIALKIDPDARLAAAAGGAARFLADSAGLASTAVGELQKSVVAVCQEAFEHLESEQAHLNVTLTRFPDRIEVTLSHEGAVAPILGLDQIAGLAGQFGGLNSAEGILSGIDRVQFEAQGSVAITRLTKYLGRAPQIA